MSDQTEAAVLFELGKHLRTLSLSIPELKPGQVLVEMAYSGICHTQLLEILGKRGADSYLPHTLGHEGSGRVVKVGPGVHKVKSGDRVVLSWIRGNGMDAPSTVYQSPEGPVNSGAISTFLRQAVVSENRVTPIPESMPFRPAAMLGCAFLTGAGIVKNTAKIKPGASVAVFGVGGIGSSAVLAAGLVDSVTTIAVDLWDSKLERARELGATYGVNSRSRNPLDAILEITKGKGVDVAIEAAGKRETMEMAFQCVRPGGGLCVLAGNLENGEKISIDPHELIRGKKILGTWGGETEPDADVALYVKQYLSGGLKLDSLITHEYPLDRINQAFDDLLQGRVGRALVNFHD